MAIAPPSIWSQEVLGAPGRLLSGPWPPAILWAPALLVAGAMLLPLAYLLLRTLEIGGDLEDLLLRTRTLQILLRSLALVLVVTGGCIIIAVPLAWLTVRTDLPLQRLWTVLTVLPLVIPSYVGGFLVLVALGPRGLLQGWLEPLGVERLPDLHGFPGAALVLTLLSYPYVLLAVRAALWRLDPSLEEAARGLGQGAWSTFRHTTLPLLRPAIAAGGVLVALYTLSDFGAVSLLGYETFTWAIYLQYETFARSQAAALALVLVPVAFGILALEAGTRGSKRYYRSGVGSARPPTQVRLGRWRWPALGLCALVALLAVAMPVSILGYWLVRGIAANESFRPVWEPALNSVYISGLAAVAATAAALPVAILAARFPGLGAALVERLAYVGYSVPHIVVALALVSFGLYAVPPLYQSVGLLVFAYVVLFLPIAASSLRASLIQINPRLEEAARGLGRSPWGVFRAITLPLARPGILAGGALVFLVTMKELPVTLILSPIGFTTLATSIWAADTGVFFAQTAAAALLLVLVSSLAVFLIILQERRVVADR